MSGRRAQLEFAGKGFRKPGDEFGGSLLKGNPKCKRPLDSKFPVHLVLRATRGGMRLPKAFSVVNEIVTKTAQKHGFKVYRYANVGNHLHLLVKINHVRDWPAFIRELCGRIAQTMRELIKLPQGEAFWLFRPFTRIVRGWHKAFRSVCDYIHLNFLEAEGFISRKETKSLKDLRAIWGDG